MAGSGSEQDRARVMEMITGAWRTRVIGDGDVRVRRLITPPSERKRQRRQEKQRGLGQIRSLAVLFAALVALTEGVSRVSRVSRISAGCRRTPRWCSR